jgi:hypothetical protein
MLFQHASNLSGLLACCISECITGHRLDIDPLAKVAIVAPLRGKRGDSEMRWMRATLLGMGMTTLAANGCQTSAARFEAPPLREEYILPPLDDPRFSSPPTFPKDAMDQMNIKKDNNINQKFGGPMSTGLGKATPAPATGF